MDQRDLLLTALLNPVKVRILLQAYMYSLKLNCRIAQLNNYIMHIAGIMIRKLFILDLVVAVCLELSQGK